MCGKEHKHALNLMLNYTMQYENSQNMAINFM